MRDRPGRKAYIAAIVLHVGLVSIGLVYGAEWGNEPPEFIAYHVEIVSPPPAVEGLPEPVVAELEPEPVPEPEPEPPEPEPPEPEPEPEPPEPEPEPEPEPPEPEPEPEPDPPPAAPPQEPEEQPSEATEEEPAGPRPDPESTQGGENLDVQITGEEFPFPDYLQNVIVQVNRFFRWTGTPGLEAEVYFAIRRDGSVQDIRLVSGAREVAFNFEAMAAVEQAGNRKAFGALPSEFQRDLLPISFYFKPQR